MLPSFTSEGLLPAGDYLLTFDELRASILVIGPGEDYPNWDATWRLQLVTNLQIMAQQLWQAGIQDIFIDGYFNCDRRTFASGELQHRLNLLDPYKVWTWDPAQRRPYRNSAKKQLPMWHRYRVELYPHFGQFSGILDRFGNELECPSAFRQSRRDGKPRGIVKLGDRHDSQ